MRARFELDWTALIPYVPRYLQGLQVTIGLALVAMVVSVLLGLLLALMSRSRWRLLRAISATCTWVFRAIPIYVYLLWVYYGLPIALGVNLSPIAAGVVCLGSQFAAFQAEVFRAGLGAISRGQVEAALSVGLNRVQVFFSIVLPQMLRLVLPSSGNNFVLIVRDTALVSVIGVFEITRYTQLAIMDSYRAFEFYTALAVLYAALILILSAGVTLLERRLAIPSH